jgi:hypothetical protein
MATVRLRDFLARVEARKLALGMTGTAVDAMRNKGGARSAAKRELLARAEARARKAAVRGEA